MRIARFSIAGTPIVAVDAGDGFIDYETLLESRGFALPKLGQNPERFIIRMIRNGLFDLEFIRENIDFARHSGLDLHLEPQLLKPLLLYRPCKFICMARNYRDHAKEGGHKVPSKPNYFIKTDNCAIGPGESIILHKGLGRVDYEGELGVVIGKKASKVKAEYAEKYILGYTIVNDVTAREFQKQLASEGLPWAAAKSLDSFAPMGPWIEMEMTPEEVSEKRIIVRVNGEKKQDALIKDMIFNIRELIEFITATITLNTGDIIATGTPSGVGPLKSGDEVEVEIEGIGKLINPVK